MTSGVWDSTLHIIQAQVYYRNSNTYIFTILFKFTIEKVFKTGLVVLIQYRQSRPWLCYASPCPIRHGTLPTHGTHNTSRHDDVRAAKYIKLSPFSTSLEPSFSNTRGSLNFLTVHSCSQNLPLIGCMYA